MKSLYLRSAAMFVLAFVGPGLCFGQITFSGFDHSSLGSSSLSTGADGKLSVDNLGSSGQDGVSIDSSGGDGVIVRKDNEDGFGADLDTGDIVFNPMATGVPGIDLPPTISLSKNDPLHYSLTILNSDGSGGTVGNGNEVFVDLLDANGGVAATLPISTAGVVGEFDFTGGSLDGILAVGSRDVLKTYFETGDIPTQANFAPNSGNPTGGVHGFQVRYSDTPITNLEVRYGPSTAPATRSIERTFVQKTGGFAAGFDGGMILTGLGNAELDLGSRLVVDNLGSSGQDGVSISFGGPDLSGGTSTGARVEKFREREAYGQVQQQAKQVAPHGNPLYEEDAAASNPLYSGSIFNPQGGGIELSFEASGLGTDTFRLSVFQGGSLLHSENLAGLQANQPALSLGGALEDGLLDTLYKTDGLTWEFDVAASTAATALGTNVQLNPSLPVSIEFLALNQTTPAADFGRVDLLYSGYPDGTVISSLAIPEPNGCLLLMVAGLAGVGSRRRL